MKRRVYTILCRNQGAMLTYLQLDDKISRQTMAKKLANARALSKDRRNDNGIVPLSLMFVCCGKEELRVSDH